MNNRGVSDVVVIGAGLAGGFTAHALAQRGATVTVLESCDTIASKASGNRCALLTPYITTKPSELEAVYSSGFRYTHTLLRKNARLAEIFTESGAIQLPSTARLAAALANTGSCLGDIGIRRVSTHGARAICGIETSSDAFHIPEAGFLDPRALVHSLLSEPPARISIVTGTQVLELTEAGGSWCVTCSRGDTYHAKIVVICNAYEAAKLKQSSWLPLEPVRGQTVSVRANECSRDLRTPIMFGGYITPASEGSHLVGAHYRHDDDNESVSQSDSVEVVARCNEWLRAVRFTESEIQNGRVCFRTSTLDRLPYCGAVADYDTFKHESARFQSGTDLIKHVSLTYHRGLFCNLGHGSRGLLSCPIGAEIIATSIFGEEQGEFATVARRLNLERLMPRIVRTESR